MFSIDQVNRLRLEFSYMSLAVGLLLDISEELIIKGIFHRRNHPTFQPARTIVFFHLLFYGKRFIPVKWDCPRQEMKSQLGLMIAGMDKIGKRTKKMKKVRIICRISSLFSLWS